MQKIIKRMAMIFLIIVLGSNFIACGNDEKVNKDNKSSFSEGEVITLSEDLLVCISKDAFEEIGQALSNKDNKEFNRLVANGKAFEVKKGEKIKIKKYSFNDTYEIEVISNGKTGITLRNAVSGTKSK